MSVSTQHDVSTKAEKSHVRSVHSVKTRVAQEGGVDTLAAVIISTAAVVRPARTGKVRNAMRPVCVSHLTTEPCVQAMLCRKVLPWHIQRLHAAFVALENLCFLQPQVVESIASHAPTRPASATTNGTSATRRKAPGRRNMLRSRRAPPAKDEACGLFPTMVQLLASLHALVAAPTHAKRLGAIART